MKRAIVFVSVFLLLSLPIRAQQSDSLSILLFGHSYGVDCTEHLPKLLDAAGIKTVRIARFKKSNCSLKERYKFFVTDNPNGYTECQPGRTEWVERPCTFREAIATRAWDYVIFQNSLENEGRYKTAQPYLNDMVDYVRKTSRESFGKEPVICWNMFWPMSKLLEHTDNSGLAKRMSHYGHNSEKMWAAYMSATKELMADTGIDHIIPSGTAVMNLRASYLNTSEMREFTKDGYHMSSGAGRYAVACVFFEYFVAPKYGVSIIGNSLRLPDLPSPVTDDNAAFLQECAADAVAHPFQVKQWPPELAAQPNTLTRLVREVKPLSIKRYVLCAGAEKSFSLLHISDSHLAKADNRDSVSVQNLAGKRAKPWSEHYHEEAIRYARDKHLYLIHTGDLIDFISEANLDIAASYFQMDRYLICPGNHEFAHSIGGQKETDAYKAASFNHVQEAYPVPLDYYSRVINGVNFILLDDSYYKISQQQWDFVRAEFDKGLPVILLCHVPLYTPEHCKYALEYTKGRCAYLTGVPESITATFTPDRVAQQHADETTLGFISWLREQSLLKAILCGHCHYNYVYNFSSTANQYTVGALYQGDAYEFEIR